MRFWVFIFIIFSFFSCKKKSIILSDINSITEYASTYDEQNVSGSFRCNSSVDYAPDPNFPEQNPERLIKVVFHIMNAENKQYNFDGDKAIDYFTRMLEDANGRLGRNEKLNLPVDNDYPVLDPGYRYQLYRDSDKIGDTGFQFHYDNDLYFFVNKGANRNNYKKDVIKKYAIKQDSIINIFIMPHHPDSIASSTYPGYGSGIALGTSLKMAGIFESGAGPHAFSSILNHEVGHILGLQHSWTKYDGCEDTAEHPNCYGPSKEPPCNKAISNNMMDYNFAQIALSPCQIGKIHKNFARLNSKQRKLIQASWCTYKKEMSITISDSVDWVVAKDIEGDIIIDKNGCLTLKCRLSMPKGSKIIIEPGGRLILNGADIHNSCGDNWSGIEVLYKKKKSGKVIIINQPKIRDLEGDASQA